MQIVWTRNRLLAGAAFALGVVALFGRPTPGHTVRLDTQELATIVADKVDHVSAVELADWIIQNKSDYRLVDVRTPDEFAAYHIPTAENVPITQLPDFGLGRTEKIVLYSEGGIHSAQAWMLLRAEKYAGVYILFGGLDAWNDEVLHPVAPVAATPQQTAAFERAAQVARFFGGAPRAASAHDTTLLALAPPPVAAAPKVAAPKSPAGTAPAAPAKKKKEGC